MFVISLLNPVINLVTHNIYINPIKSYTFKLINISNLIIENYVLQLNFS